MYTAKGQLDAGALLKQYQPLVRRLAHQMIAKLPANVELDDLIRFDHGSQTFVIIRSEDDTFHAMDGICSHEKVHLCDGLVMEGTVECPKHNATFDYRTGEAKRAPACVNLKTFPVRVQDGQVWIEI